MDTCFKLRLLLIEKSDILFSKTAFPGCINTDFYILFFAEDSVYLHQLNYRSYVYQRFA